MAQGALGAAGVRCVGYGLEMDRSGRRGEYCVTTRRAQLVILTCTKEPVLIGVCLLVCSIVQKNAPLCLCCGPEVLVLSTAVILAN